MTLAIEQNEAIICRLGKNDKTKKQRKEPNRIVSNKNEQNGINPWKKTYPSPYRENRQATPKKHKSLTWKWKRESHFKY